MSQVATLFSKIKIDYSWSFADKTRKDTAYITHGYHRYPAKFILIFNTPAPWGGVSLKGKGVGKPIRFSDLIK